MDTVFEKLQQKLSFIAACRFGLKRNIRRRFRLFQMFFVQGIINSCCRWMGFYFNFERLNTQEDVFNNFSRETFYNYQQFVVILSFYRHFYRA